MERKKVDKPILRQLPCSIRHDRSNLLLSQLAYTLSRPTCIDRFRTQPSSRNFDREAFFKSSVPPIPPCSQRDSLFYERERILTDETSRRNKDPIQRGAAEISQQPLDSTRHKVKGKTSTVINSTAPCILFKTVSSLTCAHRETPELVPLRLQLDFSTN